MNGDKRRIRNDMLAARLTLSDDDVAARSFAVSERLKTLPAFAGSRIVMCYADFKNEVRMRGFIDYCLSSGRKVALPLVAAVGTGKDEISAFEVTDPDMDLELGAYGIPEPSSSIAGEIPAYEIDFIVVPGVAFDPWCRRLGYGKGYYDRFLSRLKSGCFKAGAAFEMQIVCKLPEDTHDVRLNAVVTEKRVICEKDA